MPRIAAPGIDQADLDEWLETNPAEGDVVALGAVAAQAEQAALLIKARLAEHLRAERGLPMEDDSALAEIEAAAVNRYAAAVATGA